jgi:hypothetical protein
MGGHIPESIVLKLKDTFDIQYGIETGIYKAGSTKFLCREFQRVWAVEMDRGWYNRALEMKKDVLPNATLIFGDSRDILPYILADPDLDSPALIWLDAHWCGGARPKQSPNEECPLDIELSVLRNCDKDHFVLIDDARCFLGRPDHHHNPDLWPTYDFVRSMQRAHYICKVYNDVIYMLPDKAEILLDQWAQENGYVREDA